MSERSGRERPFSIRLSFEVDAHARRRAQLYTMHREEDEDQPAAVVGWGLAFANGEVVTLWCDPHPGAAITVGSLWKVEEYHAPNRGADLVWLTGSRSPS